MKFRFTFLTCFCLVFLVGCQQAETETVINVDETRIISFSPGITQTIVDLGHGDKIVGRSAFCKAVPSSVPVVGDLLGVDYERLRMLNPSHVFVQKTQSKVNQHLLDLSESGLFELQTWKLDRLDDIKELFTDLSTQLSDSPQELEFKVDNEQTLPSPILVVTQGTSGSAGLCFGVDTYLDDILGLMGVHNALKQSGWRSLSLEDIASLKPACILVVSDTIVQEESLRGIRSLGIPVIPFVHQNVLIPSSQITFVAQSLQESMRNQ